MREAPSDDPVDAWLQSLGDGVSAPARLRRRVLRELRSRGVVAWSKRRRAWALIAAALVLGAALALVESQTPSSPAGRDARLYVLILDTVTENYEQMSPEQAAPLAEDYTRWLHGIEAAGMLRESYYLASTESAAGLDAVSGVVIVEADSREDVETIVRSSPHIRRGGTIRIRELAPER